MNQLLDTFAAEARGRRWTVVHDETHGSADFGRIGRCTFDVGPDGLLIDLRTADPLRHLLLSHSSRLARRAVRPSGPAHREVAAL